MEMVRFMRGMVWGCFGDKGKLVVMSGIVPSVHRLMITWRSMHGDRTCDKIDVLWLIWPSEI